MRGHRRRSLLGKRKRCVSESWLYTMHSKEAAELQLNSFDGLRSWLGVGSGDSSIKDFLHFHWRKHCVVVKGAGRKVNKLVPRSIKRLCEESSSEAIQIWLQTKSKLETLETTDAASATRLHRAGLVLYCRAPERTEEVLVGSMIRDTDFGLPQAADLDEPHHFAAWGEVECFLSHKDHVTDFHYDFQENFTLQIRGTKRWTLRPTRHRHPLRARSTHFVDTPGVAEDQAKAVSFCETRNETIDQHEYSVILKPGDGLYFPAGFEHRVETLSGDNLSINISLLAPTVADLIAGSLRHALLRNEDTRKRICSHDELIGAFRIAQRALRRISQSLIDTGDNRAIIPVLKQSNIYILTDRPPSSVKKNLPAYFKINILASLLPQHAIEDTFHKNGKHRHSRTNLSTSPEFSSHLQQQRWAIFCLLHGSSETLQPTLRTKLFMPALLYDYFFFTVLPKAAASSSFLIQRRLDRMEANPTVNAQHWHILRMAVLTRLLSSCD